MAGSCSICASGEEAAYVTKISEILPIVSSDGMAFIAKLRNLLWGKTIVDGRGIEVGNADLP